MNDAIQNHPRKVAAGAALAGACIALACTTVGGFEGKVNATYFDIVGVPTYCYGGTGPQAKPGARFTDAQCTVQLSNDLQTAWRGMQRCAPEVTGLSDQTKVAFVSFAYNVGQSNFCKSSIPAKLKVGNIRAACDTLSLWDKAGGKVVRGLQVRRAAERNLCIASISQGKS